MNKKLLYIAATVMTLTTAGCADSDPLDENTYDRELTHVSFRICLDAPTATRSDNLYDGKWGDNYDPAVPEAGTVFESAVKDVYPVLYRLNSSGVVTAAVGRVIHTSTTLLQTSDGTATYEVNGVLEPISETLTIDKDYLTGNKFRIGICANFNPGTTATQLSHPGNFTAYGQENEVIGTGESAVTFSHIPMWGSADVDFSGIKFGITYQLPEIPMLRAMAQIRLTVSDDMWNNRNVRLVSLGINRLQPTGAILPLFDWKGIKSVNDLPFGSLNTTATMGATSEITYQVAAEEVPALQRTLKFYMPELENGTKEIIITAKYTADDGETVQTGQIYLCPYSDTGKPDRTTLRNIVRNHIYEYTIIGVPAANKPEIRLCIKQWGYVKRDAEL